MATTRTATRPTTRAIGHQTGRRPVGVAGGPRDAEVSEASGTSTIGGRG